MKKFALCLLCLGLVACDNSGMTGVCYVHETVSQTKTEKKTITAFLCGCFDNTKVSESGLASMDPNFTLPMRNHQIASTTCYKECTKMCNEEVKKQKIETK